MIRFIDLFAGIGGFRLAFESVGAKCVFSAEIDRHACSTYQANFGDYPLCDVSKLDPKEIPDFDILCAGFPCQPFLLALQESEELTFPTLNYEKKYLTKP